MDEPKNTGDGRNKGLIGDPHEWARNYEKVIVRGFIGEKENNTNKPWTFKRVKDTLKSSGNPYEVDVDMITAFVKEEFGKDVYRLWKRRLKQGRGARQTDLERKITHSIVGSGGDESAELRNELGDSRFERVYGEMNGDTNKSRVSAENSSYQDWRNSGKKIDYIGPDRRVCGVRRGATGMSLENPPVVITQEVIDGAYEDPYQERENEDARPSEEPENILQEEQTNSPETEDAVEAGKIRRFLRWAGRSTPKAKLARKSLVASILLAYPLYKTGGCLLGTGSDVMPAYASVSLWAYLFGEPTGKTEKKEEFIRPNNGSLRYLFGEPSNEPKKEEEKKFIRPNNGSIRYLFKGDK